MKGRLQGEDFDWPDKTLTEIEGNDWGPPTFPSFVVSNGHRLRKKPLRSFSVGDLRFMLGQQISLPILMPMALDVLEQSPFVMGDSCSGDLLNAALQVDRTFWKGHADLWHRLNVIIVDIEEMARLIEEELRPAAWRFLEAIPEG